MKRFFYSLAITAVALVIGCQTKGSEPVKVNYTAAELVGNYSAKDVFMTTNGQKMDGATLAVSGTDLAKMVFSIKLDDEVVPFSNVVVTNNADGCYFSDATSYPAGSEFVAVLTGDVINGKFHLAFAVEETLDINGTYEHNEVSVELSGNHFDLLAGQTVTIAGEVGNQTISLPASVVPGESALQIKITPSQVSPNVVSFTGIETNDDRDIVVTGMKIDEGELHIVLTPNYKNEMVGGWNFPTPIMGEDEWGDPTDVTAASVMPFEIRTPDGMAQFFGMPYAEEDLAKFLSQIGGIFLRAYLPLDETKPEELTCLGAMQKINFHADGNLTVQYNTNFDPTLIMSALGMPGANTPVAPNWVDSPKGAMRWYKKGDQLFLVPNLNLMTKAGISSDGLPFNIRKDEMYSYIYVTKDFVAPMLNLANMIVAGLPNEVLGGDLAPMAKMMVNDITFSANKATIFNIGINLEKEQ